MIAVPDPGADRVVFEAVAPSVFPPAGWYDDPEQPLVKRYWNGDEWTPLIEGAGRTGIGQARMPPKSEWLPPAETSEDTESSVSEVDHWTSTGSTGRTVIVGAIALTITAALAIVGIEYYVRSDRPKPTTGTVEVAAIAKSCKGADGVGRMRLTVLNGTAERSSVTISVRFFDAREVQIGEGLAVLKSLDPGVATEVEAIGVLTEDSTLVTCGVPSVLVT